MCADERMLFPPSDAFQLFGGSRGGNILMVTKSKNTRARSYIRAPGDILGTSPLLRPDAGAVATVAAATASGDCRLGGRPNSGGGGASKVDF